MTGDCSSLIEAPGFDSEEGIRLTLVDWFSGMARGYDFYVPHRNIESALVCTEEHDLDDFGKRAGKWKIQMGPTENKPNTEKAE